MVAEINKGSQNFGDVPLTQPPGNFGSKVVFGKQLPVPKWYKNKFVAPVMMGTVCFKQKTNIYNAKLRKFGRQWGQGGQNC